MTPNLYDALSTQPSTSPEAVPLDTAVIAENDAAEYIEAMCSELLTIADRAGLGFLGYLLEVAREEAIMHIRQPASPAPQKAYDPMAVYGEVPPKPR